MFFLDQNNEKLLNNTILKIIGSYYNIHKKLQILCIKIERNQCKTFISGLKYVKKMPMNVQMASNTTSNIVTIFVCCNVYYANNECLCKLM